MRDKNTLRSKGGRPMSSAMSSGGVNDDEYECGFGISPHVNRTSNIRIDEVRVEVRAFVSPKLVPTGVVKASEC